MDSARLESTASHEAPRLAPEEAVREIGRRIPLLIELDKEFRQSGDPGIGQKLAALKLEIESI